MSKVPDVRGIEILDSRGNPKAAAIATLDCGVHGISAAPSGASAGSREAIELRDSASSRYGRKGVRIAVSHVNG